MHKCRVVVCIGTDGGLHPRIVIVVVHADRVAAGGRMVSHGLHRSLRINSVLLLLLMMLLLMLMLLILLLRCGCCVNGRVLVLDGVLAQDGAGGGRRGDGIIMWICRVIAIGRVNSIEACQWRGHCRGEYQVGDMRPLGGHSSLLGQFIQQGIRLAES